MEVLTQIEALRNWPEPLVLAIGVFDGVHRGHQKVIATALDLARREEGSAVVVTFRPHPIKVLRPDKAPRLLTATPHKLRLLTACGIERVLLIEFNVAFSQKPAEEFIDDIAGAGAPLRHIVVGENWTFGHQAQGNLTLLREKGAQLGFSAVGVSALEEGGEPISSTRVRRNVAQGDFAAVEQLLGRPYTVLGTVIEGEHIGRKLGSPTANLSVHNEQLPPSGVYVVRCIWESRELSGVANLGTRPTLGNAHEQRLLEVHLFDFEGEIYGQDIEVEFLHFLRPETKFEDLDALKTQIARDVRSAREFLK